MPVQSSSATNYVTLPEVRAMPNLSDSAKFSDSEVQSAMDWFEVKFEEHVGMAFVPRTTTERITAAGTTIYLKHWPVRSVVAVRSYTSPTASTAFTAAELADLLIDASGGIRRYSLGYWPTDTEVVYVHGQEAPPSDIKDVALVAIRQKLLADQSGDRGNRQLGIAQEGVFVRNTQGPFFNDEVNDVANAYRAKYHVPAVA